MEENLIKLLALPQKIEKLTAELARLNDNIEKIAEMKGQLDNLVEIMSDLRTMAGPMLGYRVKK